MKVAAVPVVKGADLGTLVDPDNQGRTLDWVLKQHCCQHNESQLGKIQQYVGTKYVEETGQGEDSGSTKYYNKEVCLAGCPLRLWWYIIIIQIVKYLFWRLQGEPEYIQQHCQVLKFMSNKENCMGRGTMNSLMDN